MKATVKWVDGAMFRKFVATIRGSTHGQGLVDDITEDVLARHAKRSKLAKENIVELATRSEEDSGVTRPGTETGRNC